MFVGATIAYIAFALIKMSKDDEENQNGTK